MHNNEPEKFLKLLLSVQNSPLKEGSIKALALQMNPPHQQSLILCEAWCLERIKERPDESHHS